MIGPLSKLPFNCCHVSKMTNQPKEVNERRIIIDLYYKGNQSINGCTPRGVYDVYAINVPSSDYLIQEIMNIDNLKLMKVDIAQAFSNVRKKVFVFKYIAKASGMGSNT